jgi:hypothetical protein
MSTTERMYSDEDIEVISEDLKAWPNSFWGDDDQDWAVSPFTSFYFLYDSEKWVDISLAMVEIHERFATLTQQPYMFATHPESERPHPFGSKRLPDLRDFARKTKKDDHFLFKVTSEKNHRSSPAHAGYFWKKPAYMNDRPERNNKRYSTIQLYYRWAWWRENVEQWREFVIETIRRLAPEFVYSGFGIATPLTYGARTETTVWERALTPHFYGLDIDDPSAMEMHGDGIRPPTWGFLLEDSWRDRLQLSREQVRDFLHQPEITVRDVANGQWIELGHEPDLYPVGGGVPPALVLANRLLRPIRNDHMTLVGFPEWDGDPNQRFDREDSIRWLRRFDDDSDWPTKDMRHMASQGRGSDKSPPQEDELRAKSGEPSPTAGRWQSVDTSETVRYYEKDELLASLDSTYGLTVWRYLGP